MRMVSVLLGSGSALVQSESSMVERGSEKGWNSRMSVPCFTARCTGAGSALPSEPTLELGLDEVGEGATLIRTAGKAE